jgi:2-(1,2-epoxy-1,2-dihydrophenyl)acetyl-CoA isomerase
MDMASMADLRFASDQAKFRMSYSLMGIVPGDAGCYYLPRIIGIARALEMIWTARIVGAEEALSMGYLTRMVPPEDLMDETMEFARKLANGPRVATEVAKRMAYNMLNMDLNAALDYSQLAMNIARATEDSKEGPKAFVEKREPNFQGL